MPIDVQSMDGASMNDGRVPGGALPLMSELVTAPAFRVAFRGYDTKQVDRYAHLIEAELEATKHAHAELAADLRSLADQLDRAHEELAVLRRRPSVDDAIAFRHLGPRVEEILANANAEADEILAAARRRAQELQASSEQQVGAVRAEHAREAAEFEERRRWLREEEERWTRLLRSRQEQVTRAEHYRRKVQEGAEQILTSATLQHERVVASALARSEQMLAEATAQAEQIRGAAQRSDLGDQADPGASTEPGD
jgi:cell division septum initiation protein DivIVA